ncbi:MAG: RNA exonuclease 3 [Stictis urceolatum]|nr:RNA exonuclease 3 [Stictis urceolata]
MFKCAGLFGSTQCPLGEKCGLLNCIFSHKEEPHPTKEPDNGTKSASQAAALNSKNEGPPPKRQRIDNVSPKGTNMTTPRANSSKYQTPLPSPPVNPFSSLTGSSGTTTSLQSPAEKADSPSLSENAAAPSSARRPISSPQARKSSSDVIATRKRQLSEDASEAGSPAADNVSKRMRNDPKVEALNPRLMAKPPAAHAVRMKLLKLVYEHMYRLNQELMESKDGYWKNEIGLSKQGVITLALDEEERAAKSNAAVYANVLKLRIVALKKMTRETWKAERMKEVTRKAEAQKPKSSTSKPVDLSTGLTPAEEISMLPQFFSHQHGLSEHGYVLKPPSPHEVESTRKGLASAGGWETCDRCNTRFQVFPGRRESDGALTSGGTCTYHWGRQRRPERRPGHTVHADKQYTCCKQELGTSGCVEAESHVFKASAAKRLELVMPFEKTPTPGPNPVAANAVCFDCEMGYTTQGMELIRLTVTEWPTGKALIDVLVRPLGEILDLNSRFSGVWPADFTSAVAFTPKKATKQHSSHKDDKKGPLSIVETPAAARNLLFANLTTTTPLVGHAIENDLNAVRIIHPTIIDTVLLYPHPAGLPVRYGLKVLAKQHLSMDIQTGGDKGHDSKEDARAAGDLVRLKVQEKWRSMETEGWTAKGGIFYPPEVK